MNNDQSRSEASASTRMCAISDLLLIINSQLMVNISSYSRYAVLDGNACLCTNTINESEVNFDECDRNCTEKPNEFCGGAYVQSYYDTDVKVAGPPRNIRIVNQTDSSILIQWSAPEQRNDLSQYIIRANLLKKYGPKHLPPLPQWSVDKSDNLQYELFNLNPGMK